MAYIKALLFLACVAAASAGLVAPLALAGDDGSYWPGKYDVRDLAPETLGQLPDGAVVRSALAAPAIAAPGLIAGGIAAPGLIAPGIAAPGLIAPGIAARAALPGLAVPTLARSGLALAGHGLLI